MYPTVSRQQLFPSRGLHSITQKYIYRSLNIINGLSEVISTAIDFEIISEFLKSDLIRMIKANLIHLLLVSAALLSSSSQGHVLGRQRHTLRDGYVKDNEQEEIPKTVDLEESLVSSSHKSILFPRDPFAAGLGRKLPAKINSKIPQKIRRDFLGEYIGQIAEEIPRIYRTYGGGSTKGYWTRRPDFHSNKPGASQKPKSGRHTPYQGGADSIPSRKRRPWSSPRMRRMSQIRPNRPASGPGSNGERIPRKGTTVQSFDALDPYNAALGQHAPNHGDSPPRGGPGRRRPSKDVPELVHDRALWD